MSLERALDHSLLDGLCAGISRCGSAVKRAPDDCTCVVYLGQAPVGEAFAADIALARRRSRITIVDVHCAEAYRTLVFCWRCDQSLLKSKRVVMS